MEENRDQIIRLEKEINALMPYESFLQIHERQATLRQEEEERLKMLAELQKTYVAASTDQEREKVREVVGKIRELSRAAREEIRSLNREIQSHMPIERARELYQRLIQLKSV